MTKMYKNLNAESLGINGRHNELIELTLTYKFRGFDLEIADLMQQIESRGKDHATRFIQSANVKLGSFDLPIDLAAADDQFATSLEHLEEVAALAGSLRVKRCIYSVLPYCLGRRYHENFDLHRERIGQVCSLLDSHDIRLGLGFSAASDLPDEGDSQFITTPDALLALIQTISQDVGLCLDTWHWYVGGGTIGQLDNFPIDKIIMVRLADAPADVDLASMTVQQRLLPGSTCVVPNVEWLRWLTEHKYEGPITPYCHPEAVSGSTRNQTVGQAAEALDRLLQAARNTDGSEAEEQTTTAS